MVFDFFGKELTKGERREKRIARQTVTEKVSVKKGSSRIKVGTRKFKLGKIKRVALGLRGGSPLTTPTRRRGLQSDPFLG